MGKNVRIPKDPRSTGRRRAQRVLEKEVEEGRLEKVCARESCLVTEGLDVNHKNKNVLDNDPTNLEYLCRTHHYEYDRATGKGENPLGDQFGYGL